MIRAINGWFYLTGIGAFHAYPFPTKRDAEEALRALTGDTQCPADT
jgi:hypothetical protein